MTREEAIKIVKRLYNNSLFLKKDKEAMLTLVPELVESDDERIREEMVRYFTEMKKGGSAALPYDDCIAYLERQKEQKPVVTHGETYHVDTLGTQQVIAGKMPQKPAEWSEEDRRIIDRACVALRAYANGDLPEFLPSELIGYADRLQSLRPQPKEEWSEEDEDMRDTIIRDLKHLGGDMVNVSPAYKEEIDWLKSLPERFNLQPKVEWSKEDEKILDSLIRLYSTEYSARAWPWSDGVITYGDVVNFLKSLRPS